MIIRLSFSIEQKPERDDVRASIDFFAEDVLGRHIRYFAANSPDFVSSAVRPANFVDTEVDDLRQTPSGSSSSTFAEEMSWCTSRDASRAHLPRSSVLRGQPAHT